MAANNYFGFTHSGTQYTATPGAAAAAAAYQAQQGGYAVAPTGASTPAATYTAQRAATGYDYGTGTAAYAGVNFSNVQSAAPAAAAATTYDYGGYARTAAQAYDTSKTYYQQPAASAASYSTTDYSGWTQATSAQKPAAAVSAVYTYTSTQPQRNSATAPKSQSGLPPSVGTAAAAAYSTQTYGTQPASNTYSTSGYSTVPTQNKFSATSSQVKKPLQSYAQQSSLSYNSNSYASQQQTPSVVTSYSTYNQNKSVLSGNQNKQQSSQSQQSSSSVSLNKPVTTVGGMGVGGVGGSNISSASTPSSNYSSSYDAALYNAASMYVNQQTPGGVAAAVAAAAAGVGGVAVSTQNKPQWKNYSKPSGLGGAVGGGGGGGTGGPSTFNNKFQRPKLPPKPQQIHYCEVCKISCAGPLTYKEHLEGSRHKKKEQAQKAESKESSSGGSGSSSFKPSLPARGTVFKCDLCSVSCTGTDAYSAHLRGVKHQKVVKLHQKLGKPIPEPDPKATAILRAKAEAAEAARNAAANAAAAAAAGGGTTSSDGGGVSKVVAPPKINFIASGSLATTHGGRSETTASEKSSEDVDMLDDNILPVGEDYVDEIKGEDGKLQTFHCKLCDCKFNDPNAKDMHMKGKRHRLAYKKKVDPSLVVEMKPNFYQKKQKEQRERFRSEYSRRREEERVSFWADKLMEQEERMYWDEIRRYEEEMEYYEWNMRWNMGPMPPPPPPMAMGGPRSGPQGPARGPMPPPPPPPPMLRGGPPPRLETYDDRHVIAKHAAVLPSKESMRELSKVVENVEKSLKNVSDLLVEALIQGGGDASVKKEPGAAEKKPDNLKTLKEKEEKRVLKGVNRVGSLAKNILMPGEMFAELIVLCAEKPTLTLLRQVVQHLPEQLKLVAPNDTFEVVLKQADAGFVVNRKKENAEDVTINVVLTSPIIREEILEKQAAVAAEKAAVAAAKAVEEAKKKNPDAGAKVETSVATTPAKPIVKTEPKDATAAKSSPSPAAVTTTKKPDPKDLLNVQKCLGALASLRHAKWFQAKADPLQGCVMIIRLLRNMGQPWNLLNLWALELLVEKILASAKGSLSPGDGFRRVMEAIASGLLLPSGPGLVDPCEKDPVDVLAGMSSQDREEVTVAGQIALRQIAFHQIHKLLDMEQVKPKKNFGGRSSTRKRRRDTSSGEKDDAAQKKEKKEVEDKDKMETK